MAGTTGLTGRETDPGGAGVVVAVRPRHKARGRCSCGWVGPLRVLLASAKVDALMHAARSGCTPDLPLVQSEVDYAVAPPGWVIVSCPSGCGAKFPVPMVVSDSYGSDFSGPFTAEVPELHDLIDRHLQTCSSAPWMDAPSRTRLQSVSTR
jgi:hypothetical protein